MVFTTGNTLSFGTPGDKIQQYYGEYKILIFPIISVLSIFSFFAKQRILTITPPEELVNGIILSGISAKKQCHNATVVLIPLVPRGKKDSIRRRNINTNNRYLEEESGKHKLYFLKYDTSWLNVDQSLNMDLFYEDGLHLIKEGN